MFSWKAALDRAIKNKTSRMMTMATHGEVHPQMKKDHQDWINLMNLPTPNPAPLKKAISDEIKKKYSDEIDRRERIRKNPNRI